MIWIIYFAIIFISWFMPTKIQLVIYIINLIVPDPIPFIDEIIGTVFLAKSILGKKD